MRELALTTDAIPEPRRWSGAFLAALRNSRNVRASCTTAGIHRSTAYEARPRDPAFAAAWEDALEDAIEALEAHARAMAFAGGHHHAATRRHGITSVGEPWSCRKARSSAGWPISAASCR